MAIEVDFHTRQKIKSFEEWFKDDHILIHIDSRSEKVVVPNHLKDNPALTLKMSYLFQGETTFDSSGITAYLKFSGDYFQCVIPWHTIWGMTSARNENTIWPDDLPRELVFQFAKAKAKELGGKLFGGGKGKSNPDEEQQADLSTKSITPTKPVLSLAEEEKPTGPHLVKSPKANRSKRKQPDLKRIK